MNTVASANLTATLLKVSFVNGCDFSSHKCLPSNTKRQKTKRQCPPPSPRTLQALLIACQLFIVNSAYRCKPPAYLNYLCMWICFKWFNLPVFACPSICMQHKEQISQCKVTFPEWEWWELYSWLVVLP